MVLILSYERDIHAVKLAQELKVLGLEVGIIDLSQYPKKFQMGSSLLGGFNLGKTPDSKIDLIIVRRIFGDPDKKQRKTDDMGDYIKNESAAFVSSIEFVTKATWISSLSSMIIAAAKPLQIKHASVLGLNVPNTYFGNHISQLKRFLKKIEGNQVVLKVIDSSVFLKRLPNRIESKVMLAKLLDKKDLLENVSSLKYCPVIIQEVVVKKFDLRVTYILGNFYAVKIKMNYDNSIDSRDFSEGKKYSKYYLDNDIKNKLRKLMDSLNLKFGCLDLCVDDKGKIFFLEVNPAGQWLEYEKSGFKITSCIARSIKHYLKK